MLEPFLFFNVSMYVRMAIANWKTLSPGVYEPIYLFVNQYQTKGYVQANNQASVDFLVQLYTYSDIQASSISYVD